MDKQVKEARNFVRGQFHQVVFKRGKVRDEFVTVDGDYVIILSGGWEVKDFERLLSVGLETIQTNMADNETVFTFDLAAVF